MKYLQTDGQVGSLTKNTELKQNANEPLTWSVDGTEPILGDLFSFLVYSCLPRCDLVTFTARSDGLDMQYMDHSVIYLLMKCTSANVRVQTVSLCVKWKRSILFTYNIAC